MLDAFSVSSIIISITTPNSLHITLKINITRKWHSYLFELSFKSN